MAAVNLVDELITYEQAASRLPLRIRHAIEAGMPCTGGAEHHWDAQDAEWMHRHGMRSERFTRRECLRCHVTRVNPDFRGPGAAHLAEPNYIRVT